MRVRFVPNVRSQPLFGIANRSLFVLVSPGGPPRGKSQSPGVRRQAIRLDALHDVSEIDANRYFAKNPS